MKPKRYGTFGQGARSESLKESVHRRLCILLGPWQTSLLMLIDVPPQGRFWLEGACYKGMRGVRVLLRWVLRIEGEKILLGMYILFWKAVII